MNRTGPLLAFSATTLLALTGCGASGDDPEPDASVASTPASSEAPTTGATAPPTPSSEAAPSEPVPTDDTPLEASDGTDIDACFDGTCEIAISEPIEIPIDPRFDLGTVRVEQIGEDHVALSLRDGMASTELGVGGGGGAGNRDYRLGYTLRSITDGVAIIAFYLDDE